MINVPKKLGLITNSSTRTKGVSNGEIFQKQTWFKYFRMAKGMINPKKTSGCSTIRALFYFIRIIRFLLK